MKKTLALVLALALLVALAACGAPPAANTPAPQPAGTPAPQEPATPDATLTKDTIKIGFVHISDESDMGYTYNHELGTKYMVETLGLDYNTQIINKFNIPETDACASALRELAEAGCNIIFATSFGHGDYVSMVALEYPEIEFCHATGYLAAISDIPNLHNYFASIFEARYLAGIAAGLKTETNKLGYVAAFNFAEVISGYTAFYLGAKSVNPDVTMDVIYTMSWNDPAKEAQVAQSLIDGGCDVISQHSDSTAPATVAEQNGVFQVGYNSDMIPVAPKASLVSARIRWGTYVTETVEAVLAGEAIPTDWCKGLAEDAVFLSPLNEEIAAEGTAAAIETARAAIIAGTLHPFAGPLRGVNGDGAELNLAEGEFFAESSEQSAPSFDYIVDGINVLS